MRMIIQCYRRVIVVVYFVSAILMLQGCAPSVRYAEDASGKQHYCVPPNWDYRANYRVPETKLKRIVDSYIGVRYKNRGMERSGFDCSGFVCVVFRELNHAHLPRSTGKLKWLGSRVSAYDARIGDLVFFSGGVFGGINHVGIFMGNRSFAHASTSKGVTYDSLDDEYYRKHFVMVRRIF
jgi:murein DD-endopeptidase / murein LD-carboxypeptidase